MRLFVCAMVAVLGIALFAVAALAWDRRRELLSFAANWQAGGARFAADRLRGGQEAGQTAGATEVISATVQDAEPTGNQRYMPHAVILGSLVLGMIMIIGSCAGLLSF